MPVFMDCHGARNPIAQPTLRRLLEEVRCQAADSHGVRVISYLLEDATLYCVIEAPDADAVAQHHAERNLTCSGLHRLNLSSPPDSATAAAARSALARHQRR
jgi:hypothetical protein